jgi:hypothetical protein
MKDKETLAYSIFIALEQADILDPAHEYSPSWLYDEAKPVIMKCLNQYYEDSNSSDITDKDIESVDSAKQLLSDAIDTVTVDRKEDYGEAEDFFSDIAGLWSVILHEDVSSKEVALCMIALKIARCNNGNYKRDSWLDIAGYAALGSQL